MRNLKFSFAFVIAILAIGLTVASKANKIGSRVVTACYIAPELIDAAGATFAPVQTQNCSVVLSQISGGKQWLNQLFNTSSDPTCQPGLTKYCCITFDLDPAAPASVPVLTVGSQTGRFKVVELRCKP